ncbi:hypothetical protein L3Q82_000398 [Scortum barcoo]|uniref:Uncharacterized protein n=1 Tax=Scortum barcoo TaxID=214431 RepID=A0ACB8XDA8_9TELE|nr:hypothetical protein L3Q82_000398 [Scortum barcoo]
MGKGSGSFLGIGGDYSTTGPGCHDIEGSDGCWQDGNGFQRGGGGRYRGGGVNRLCVRLYGGEASLSSGLSLRGRVSPCGAASSSSPLLGPGCDLTVSLGSFALQQCFRHNITNSGPRTQGPAGQTAAPEDTGLAQRCPPDRGQEEACNVARKQKRGKQADC